MIKHPMIDPQQLLALMRFLEVEVAQRPTPLLEEHLVFEASVTPSTRGTMAMRIMWGQ